ncbi:MAG TPA: hypothetical protein VGD06_16605 [Acidobacteriota bacterium]
MQTPHRATMIVMASAVLAAALGVMQPWNVAAEAQHGGHAGAVQHGPDAAVQHGHAADPQAHFDELARQLELTAAQQEALAGPFQEAFAAMQELHRLHDAIAAELSDEQTHKLAEMIHGMFAAGFAGQHHGDDRHPQPRH